MAIEGIHTFCWFELATTGSDETLRFYEQLFGWSHTRVPMGEMGDYILLQQGEAYVGAMFELAKESGLGQVPPNWSAYVLVQDVDASTQRAQELAVDVDLRALQLDLGDDRLVRHARQSSRW